jgi:hypothetical protein
MGCNSVVLEMDVRISEENAVSIFSEIIRVKM